MNERRTAIVTGAAGALGTAICHALQRDGLDVVGVDIVGDVPIVRADVALAADNERVVAGVLEQSGRIDVLVLNAGVQHVAPISAFPEEQWDRLHDVMVKGPFLAMRAAWHALTARPGGRVIVTASTSSFVAEAGKSAYVAAKHGLIGLVKVAALEGAPFGLTVNAVAPGWMHTPMAEGQIVERMSSAGVTREQAIAGLLSGQPVKRFIDPAEVARVVSFLAGGAIDSITAATIPVDLGVLAV
jgi:3-hydroxybutyrate dehydrogenase